MGQFALVSDGGGASAKTRPFRWIILLALLLINAQQLNADVREDSGKLTL